MPPRHPVRVPARALRRAAAAFAAAAVAAVAGLAAATPVQAQRSLVIEELHAEVQVLPDGDIVVTETLRPRFTGAWNGILRHLSLRPPDAYGADYLLAASLVSATDEAGRPLRHETNRLGRDLREFKVWVPNAEDRTATVILTYRVGNPLGHFAADSASGTEPWDELYWQVTGSEWEVPILQASARFHLPPGAAPLRFAAYYGAAASTDRAEARVEGDGVVAAGPVGPLPPGQGLTLAVGWPAGFVPRPAPGSRRAVGGEGPPSPLGLWPLLLPILVFWGAYRVWDRRGRDPKELAITTRWEPPAGLTPAEAGTLVDHSPGMHDIISTVVDLAVRGYLVIDERKKRGLLARGSDYTFHAMRTRREWSALPEHERLFLEGLFDEARRPELAGALSALPGVGGLFGRLSGAEEEPVPEGAHDSVRLSDLQQRFYKRIPKIKDALYRALVARGFYLRRPDRVRVRWAMLAAAALAASSLGPPLAAAGSPTATLAAACMFVAGPISAVVLAVFAWLMPARTEQGARAREAVLGFRRFLERVESPRYRRMITSPALFEAYLPFAIVFRCEEKWAKAFEDLVIEPPRWYRGDDMTTFRPATFVRSMGTLTTAATSTLASSPSSSGAGGGGSVGGGGGGGGGGGF
ncbi:MAG TPA: DUF2207 domain-containing protein [Longimicrobiales bacterium]|nr:DUF2207 domain-containing protein [Longimicrobiales bacterium]